MMRALVTLFWPCRPQPPQLQSQLSLMSSTYSYPKIQNETCTLGCTLPQRPFAIVEDEELVDIFRDLNNKVEVLSRWTVRV